MVRYHLVGVFVRVLLALKCLVTKQHLKDEAEGELWRDGKESAGRRMQTQNGEQDGQ